MNFATPDYTDTLQSVSNHNFLRDFLWDFLLRICTFLEVLLSYTMLYEDILLYSSIYPHILVYTRIYVHILLHPSIYLYILVCTRYTFVYTTDPGTFTGTFIGTFFSGLLVLVLKCNAIVYLEMYLSDCGLGVRESMLLRSAFNRGFLRKDVIKTGSWSKYQ
jgi:hypothetical protein